MLKVGAAIWEMILEDRNTFFWLIFYFEFVNFMFTIFVPVLPQPETYPADNPSTERRFYLRMFIAIVYGFFF